MTHHFRTNGRPGSWAYECSCGRVGFTPTSRGGARKLARLHVAAERRLAKQAICDDVANCGGRGFCEACHTAANQANPKGGA